MALQSVQEIVRRAERNFLQGNIKLGKYVNWSMHETLEKVDAYLNSRHTSGPTDSLGREKPFFNIVSAACNIWYRATDIDRKDIKFIPTNSASVVLAFIANVLLQKWMDENRFGQFLNLWGRTLARYGSAVVEFVEKGDDLHCSVIHWNKIIPDSIQFDAIPHIKKLHLTPAQLRKNKYYDQDAVDKLIKAKVTRKTLDKNQKDQLSDFIEVYEVKGEMDSRLIEKEPNLSVEDKDIKYTMQIHTVSFVAGQKQDEFQDFTLFKGPLKQDPQMITHLIEEDGRTLSIGAVEYLFDAQWMTNHSVKNMKDTLDIASRLIFQTADTHFVGRNVLTAIETGDIFVHEKDKPLERVANDKPDIAASMNFRQMWETLGQGITATPDAMRGNTPPSGTPYSSVALVTQQSNSLFELMTENKGLALEDMIKTYIIPFLKKKLKHKDEVVAILDDAGISEIDSVFIPHEAIKRFNAKTVDDVLNHISQQLNGPMDGSTISPLQPFNQQKAQMDMKQSLSQQGNKRFFVPDDIDDKTWADLFSDFEWESIKVEITNENTDKQAVMQTLSTVLQTLASNPMILQDPNAKMVFSAIMNQTGVISPLQLQTQSPQQPGLMQPGQMPMNQLQQPQPTQSPLAGLK